MTKKLFAELAKLQDWEFFALEHYFTVARMVRDTMSKNAIGEKTMAEHLGVPPKKMKAVINGAYEFDFMLLSRLQSLNQSIASTNARIKVEAENIGFTTYKNQFPLYVDRIEKLLSILESQSNPIKK